MNVEEKIKEKTTPINKFLLLIEATREIVQNSITEGNSELEALASAKLMSHSINDAENDDATHAFTMDLKRLTLADKLIDLQKLDRYQKMAFIDFGKASELFGILMSEMQAKEDITDTMKITTAIKNIEALKSKKFPINDKKQVGLSKLIEIYERELESPAPQSWKDLANLTNSSFFSLKKELIADNEDSLRSRITKLALLVKYANSIDDLSIELKTTFAHLVETNTKYNMLEEVLEDKPQKKCLLS